MKLATFNARSETVDSKPMFRSAFKRHRCIVPASGYYEWQTTSGGKQPYYFTAKDSPILSIAGVADTRAVRAVATWGNRKGGFGPPAGGSVAEVACIQTRQQLTGK
jgi:putative SOS response-associated peptidase YedK